VLLLLDDAVDERQVRALLPGGSGCGVLATGRMRLSGLEGARPIDLDALPRDDAVGLVARIVGADRAQRDPAAVHRLVEHCAGLPLALRIVGARAGAAPRTPLSWFAARLADEHRRLDELRLRDLDVRARLRVAWDALGGAERDVLGSLARREERGPDDAGSLRTLAEHRLLDEVGPDAGGEPTYRLCPLIAIFAREHSISQYSVPIPTP